ncbi:MAG: hypothetical protein ABSG91_22365 [Syntrophobacteraceae bacterium]
MNGKFGMKCKVTMALIMMLVVFGTTGTVSSQSSTPWRPSAPEGPGITGPAPELLDFATRYKTAVDAKKLLMVYFRENRGPL